MIERIIAVSFLARIVWRGCIFRNSFSNMASWALKFSVLACPDRLFPILADEAHRVGAGGSIGRMSGDDAYEIGTGLRVGRVVGGISGGGDGGDRSSRQVPTSRWTMALGAVGSLSR